MPQDDIPNYARLDTLRTFWYTNLEALKPDTTTKGKPHYEP